MVFCQSAGIYSSHALIPSSQLLFHCRSGVRGRGKKKTKDTSLNERDKDKMIKLTSLSVTTEKRNALTIEVYGYCCTLP